MIRLLTLLLLVATAHAQNMLVGDGAFQIQVAPAGNSLTNGLVAYWTLDNSASWTDSSGNGHTLTNAVGGAPTNAVGLIGNGASMGTDTAKWIATADSDDFSATGGNSLTICAWYKMAFTNANYAIVTKDLTSPAGNREWSLYQPAAGGMLFNVFTNGVAGGVVTVLCTDKIVANQTNFVIAQIDATNRIARVRVATPASVGAWVTSDAFGGFGPDGTGTNTVANLRLMNLLATYSFNGMMDEVSMHRRLLTDTEITNLWNNGSGKTYPLD